MTVGVFGDGAEAPQFARSDPNELFCRLRLQLRRLPLLAKLDLDGVVTGFTNMPSWLRYPLPMTPVDT